MEETTKIILNSIPIGRASWMLDDEETKNGKFNWDFRLQDFPDEVVLRAAEKAKDVFTVFERLKTITDDRNIQAHLFGWASYEAEMEFIKAEILNLKERK